MVRTFAVVPAVDVLGDRAVRLYQGKYDSVELDAGEPLELVRRAAAHAPPYIHVVALDAARDGKVAIELAEAVVAAAAPVPVQLGGGVRSAGDALALVHIGAARVVVGTGAFAGARLDRFVEVIGDRLVVAVDVAEGYVQTVGWTERSLPYEEALARCEAAGVESIICTAIDRDGTRTGPDLELLERVRALYGGVLLAAGGVRDRADVDAVRALDLDGVVVGRAWIEGTLDL